MGLLTTQPIIFFFMSEFKVTKTLYYQAKQLHVAKLRFCREAYLLFAPMVERLTKKPLK